MRQPTIRKAAALVLFALALSVVAAVQAVDIPRLAGTVTNVVDGDTIDVKLSSGPIRVRLHGIDSPERAQPWGKEAAAALTKRVRGKRVELEPIEQDRYERLIARVYVGGMDINGELIRNGHAWAYRRYMTKADTTYCTLEQEARSARLGLWSARLPAQTPPWEYRRRNKAEPLQMPADLSAARCVAEIGR